MKTSSKRRKVELGPLISNHPKDYPSMLMHEYLDGLKVEYTIPLEFEMRAPTASKRAHISQGECTSFFF